jgi:hypothetical protein
MADPRDAAAILRDRVLPMLDEQLERLQKKSQRRGLEGEDSRSLLDYTRACVAIRYVDIRAIEAENKAGKEADDLSGLTQEQLLAKAEELTRKAFPGYNGKNLQSLRAPKGPQ